MVTCSSYVYTWWLGFSIYHIVGYFGGKTFHKCTVVLHFMRKFFTNGSIPHTCAALHKGFFNLWKLQQLSSSKITYCICLVRWCSNYYFSVEYWCDNYSFVAITQYSKMMFIPVILKSIVTLIQVQCLRGNASHLFGVNLLEFLWFTWFLGP